MSLKKHLYENRRFYTLLLFDIFTFSIINFFYYILSHNVVNKNHFLISSIILFVVLFVSRFAFGVYKNVWRYTNTCAYLKLFTSDISAMLITFILNIICSIWHGIWHILTVLSITTIFTVYARLCYRMLYKYKNDRGFLRNRSNIAIVGAGQLGICLANDLRSNPNSRFVPKFFIDTDRSKSGNIVAGLKVYDEKNIKSTIMNNNITEIVIAISEISSDKLSGLYNFYTGLGCNIKIVETLIDSDNDSSPKIHNFQIEDLLFRKPIKLNDRSICDFYTGKTVMVTGGGGSIGSEICRQIARCNPKKLVILDNYENNAYDIQQELLISHGDSLTLAVEIASVQDADSLDKVFNKHRPNIVFHAAAHKHVPFMEHCGYQAIKNNVFGTYNTANAAEKYNVEKFVLISTDKAVNPTNVMGATKRMCEMIVQSRNGGTTDFAAVRFGNVLGSNGSVIPLFKKQIEAGGPITITDKRIIRYFMTIPEASGLVIRAGAMAKRGELFVLDMGKPIKIYDLAVNMIKLSGLKPDIDIKISEIGLRPGEKLYEELLIRTEEMEKTENDMIFIERDTPHTREEIDGMIAYLRECCNSNKVDAHTALHKLVPTFCDPENVNNTIENQNIMQTV